MSCDCGNIGCGCTPQITVESGPPGNNGYNGWTPICALVTDGSRRVLQVIDWTGGSGTKPTTGLYVGPLGLVAVIGDATDIRGATGATGADGANGDNGWYPLLAVVPDAERRVLQIYDWYGGTGIPPASGDYLGPLGPTSIIGDAEDIRGPQGEPADENALSPIGSINIYAGDADPNANWFIADGRNISRATYSDLFDLIGETYGAGDGSTTFGLPNLQGKVPVGLDSGQSEFDALAETGGEKTHTLTVNEMPSHQHTAGSISQGSYGLIRRSVVGETKTTASVDSSGAGTEPDVVTTPGPIPAQGGSQAHNNLQPYIVLNYIIRVL